MQQYHTPHFLHQDVEQSHRHLNITFITGLWQGPQQKAIYLEDIKDSFQTWRLVQD